jgi:hypothetical protein
MRRVTAILGEVFGKPLSFASEADMAFWCERGTAVHKATELFDAGILDESSLDLRIVGRLDAWQAFRREVGGKIDQMELEVVSHTLVYAGRLDRVLFDCAMFPREFVVMDIKSGKPSPWCALQTFAYAKAWMEMGNRRRRPRRMAVELCDGGRYKTEVYDNWQSDEVAWIACLTKDNEKIQNWKERNGINE